MSIVRNTETIGLLVERIICDIAGVEFISTPNRDYIKKLNLNLGDFTSKISGLINSLGISSHSGSLNKEYDFLLKNGEKLSIKTSISNDKVCPPVIGQTTIKKLDFESVDVYKRFVIEQPLKAFDMYYKYLSICQHNIFVNFKNGSIIYWGSEHPNINNHKFTFTKSLETWNESCTMKINKKSVAEFQVHKSRNCIKCRFSMNNLLSYMNHTKINIQKQNFSIKKKSIGTFNYIGSKTKLLSFLSSCIEDYTRKDIKHITSFYDLFSGTGVVSNHIAGLGCKNIIVNDIMYYGYILSCSLSKKNIDVIKIKNSISILNNLEGVDGYITNTYASGNRMYFTENNARRIDSMREYIEDNKSLYTQEEYNLLLKTLLYACSKVSNISSTYGAFLKKFKKSSLEDIYLSDNILNLLQDEDVSVSGYNKPVLDFGDITGDVCYLDPPYNARKYSTNYFVIESIANNNKPLIKPGITGIPVYETNGSGDFCSKKTVKDSFATLFSNIKTEHLFMSYNSDGILTKTSIINLLEASGRRDIVVYEQDYKRFKSNSKENASPLVEYLFCSRI